MNGPTPHQVEMIMRLRGELAEAAACVRSGRPGKECMVAALALLDKVRDNDDAVMGNRAKSVAVTWDDIRLCMTGSLKIVLNYLETESP